MVLKINTEKNMLKNIFIYKKIKKKNIHKKN